MSSTQFDLFQKSREEQFEEWVHTKVGGEIANKFIRLAIGVKRRGHKKYSAQSIIERLRWHYDMKHGPDKEGFKVNHNWRSHLSRFAMRRCPELKGFFRTREQCEQKASHAVVIPVKRKAG